MTTAKSPDAVERARLGFDPKYLRKFQDKLFVEGPSTRRRLLNFYVLLVLATIIATYGVISDSPATVIGAMIVAPLMGPIIAMTAAVVMGSLQRTLRALTLVVSGMGIVILLAMLLTQWLPDVLISFENNNEIVSRITPGLIALLTALASGAAGAFIATREEIADSLAGVAIAISLVPPLCVVGIGLSEGEWEAALGAFLLFMTNFLAILLAGGVVFLLMGLGKLANTERDRATRRNGLVLIVAATLLIAVPLTLSTSETVRNALDNHIAANVVGEWLGEGPAELERLAVTGDEVEVNITGAQGMLPVQALADSLAAGLGRPITVSLRQVPSDIVRTASSRPE
jgi:uncharacterized hydrophobic protein (TIGR00271 family)